MTSLAPVPSENQTCAHCSAPLLADQRYCLSCGQPASPVRLAFLDVLERERTPQLGGGALAPSPPVVTYAYPSEPAAGPAWLRRYAPLFSVAAVLLGAMIVGLLLGHWASQGKGATQPPQTIKIEGLAGAALGAAASTTPSTTSTTPSATSSSGTSAKSEEAAEKAEAKKEEEEESKGAAKAPPPKTISKSEVSKLEKSTGKKHEQELSKLTTAPIEVK